MPRTKKVSSSKKKESTKIPYARGFHVPSKKRCLEALNGKLTSSSEQLDRAREYDSSGDFFPPLPGPSSVDDWLAQYNETGQTYQQFLDECPWLFKRKLKYIRHVFNADGKTLQEKYPEGKIYLLPLGEFDGETTPHFTDLAEYTRVFYDVPVEILPRVKLDISDDNVVWEDTLDSKDLVRNPKATRSSSRTTRYRLASRFHSKSGQYQLQVSSVLYKLRQMIPNDSICVMALTMSELYDEETDLFVAGMAAGNQRVGVFSFSRYNPTLGFSSEFWYKSHTLLGAKEMSNSEQQRIMLQRSCKLLVHEVAHLLGVDHCIWYSCCMNGSGHLKEDFEQSMHLCPVDLRKLATLCGFDIVERYKKLMMFYSSHELSVEEEWVKKRLKYITGS